MVPSEGPGRCLLRGSTKTGGGGWGVKGCHAVQKTPFSVNDGCDKHKLNLPCVYVYECAGACRGQGQSQKVFTRWDVLLRQNWISKSQTLPFTEEKVSMCHYYSSGSLQFLFFFLTHPPFWAPTVSVFIYSSTFIAATCFTFNLYSFTLHSHWWWLATRVATIALGQADVAANERQTAPLTTHNIH